MQLERLVRKHRLRISRKTLRFCQKGYESMRQSVDPVHDEKHIDRLLELLDRFLRESEEIKAGEIDFDVLLIAIFWHDVWQSRRFSKGIVQMLVDQICEGIGSMRIAKQHMLQEGFNEVLVDKVCYSIRKHSLLQFTRSKTIEAKILRDLDKLEEWSVKRLAHIKVQLIDDKKPNPALLRIAKFYFERIMSRKKENAFSFEWSKREFHKRKKAYLERVEQLYEKYEEYL